MGGDGPRAAGLVSGFEVRVLGPVQAVRAGRKLALGGPMQRAVLAMLALEAGRVVPAGLLIEELWRGGAPAGAATTLRSYVSRLRSALHPDARLVAEGGGYVLALGPEMLDSARFEDLVGAGNDALAAGEAAVSVRQFEQALALWRGRALAGVADVDSLARESARLEELRLAAVEGRAEAALALGRHTEMAGELERLVAEHPLRERLWRLLVLALYRAERQADALAAYRRAREILAAELGLEPGEDLRRLEEAVLRQDVPPPLPAARHNLPAALTSFVGRDEDLARLIELLGRARLVTLTGPGGAGKTRLALELAGRVAERFADGTWLASLSGTTDAGLVPSAVMESLGVRQTGGIPVVEALRYRLRAAELLLVLDNCEHLLDACTELASRLLAASPGLRVLATSREPLGITGEITYPVAPLTVPPAQASEQVAVASPAVRLFLDRASAARPGGVMRMPAAAVVEVCRELDGLPLAIELAAGRASALSVQEIADHLSDRFRFLARRRVLGDPRHQTLKAAIDWSYELLSEDDRRAFRALAVFAGGFELSAAAFVCDSEDRTGALEVIDGLASKSLLVAEPAAAGTRYRVLETIRQYAADRLVEAGETGPAQRRHAQAFLSLARREHDPRVLLPEMDNFRAALEWSLSQGEEAGPRLASALGGFWLASGFFQEAREWLERAAAAVPAEPGLHAELLRLLGTVLYDSGELDSAHAILAEAAAAAESARLPALHARAKIQLADIRTMQGASPRDMLTDCQHTAAILESEGDLAGLAEAWLVIGQLHFYLGDTPADQEALDRAASYASRSGNRRAALEIRRWQAVTLTVLPIPADEAIRRAEQLLAEAAGDPRAEAAVMQALPPLYAYAGRLTDARAAVTRSQALHTRSGAVGDWAITEVFSAGEAEMIAGNPAGAERHLRDGIAGLRAMGDQAFRAAAVAMLAEAVYAQDRFAEAWQLTSEAEALTIADYFDTQAYWKATRAKLLARRGQYRAAFQLADEAIALVAATSYAALHADVLTAKAEVALLAGVHQDAAASLRQALKIYQDRHATPLAQRTQQALDSSDRADGTRPA